MNSLKPCGFTPIMAAVCVALASVSISVSFGNQSWVSFVTSRYASTLATSE
jgi:hypothetical protein